MIHVTVPRQRHIAAVSGIRLHRSKRAVDAVLTQSNPPRTTVEETVLDLTQTAATFDDLCGWVTRAIARDLTDEGRLRAAMNLRTKLRWRADLHELIAAAVSGDHSVLEYRYERDVERAHGLPDPVRQAPFAGPDGRKGRRDRLYEKYGVVIELDGRLAHPAENQWRDKDRDNAAAVSLPAARRTDGFCRRRPSYYADCEGGAQIRAVARARLATAFGTLAECAFTVRHRFCAADGKRARSTLCRARAA
jgi:hypothetical protein